MTDSPYHRGTLDGSAIVGKTGALLAVVEGKLRRSLDNMREAIPVSCRDNAPMKTRPLITVACGFAAASLLAACASKEMTAIPEVVVILPEQSELQDLVTLPEEIDFATQIKPLLEAKCVRCHNPDSQLTELSFHSRESLLAGGPDRPILVPGEPEKSTLFLVTILPDYFVEAMPADGHLRNNAVAIWSLWAESHMKRQEWDAAIGVYEQGLQRFPGERIFRNNIKYCEQKKQSDQ